MMPAIVTCDGCGANCVRLGAERKYHYLSWRVGEHTQHERYCDACVKAGKVVVKEGQELREWRVVL